MYMVHRNPSDLAEYGIVDPEVRMLNNDVMRS